MSIVIIVGDYFLRKKPSVSALKRRELVLILYKKAADFSPLTKMKAYNLMNYVYPLHKKSIRFLTLTLHRIRNNTKVSILKPCIPEMSQARPILVHKMENAIRLFYLKVKTIKNIIFI